MIVDYCESYYEYESEEELNEDLKDLDLKRH
jgi:hypothetical protein